MRERVVREDYLRRATRRVVIPAAMGIGLALLGCGSSSSSRVDAAADGRTGMDVAGDRSGDLVPSGSDGSSVKLDGSNDTAIARLDVPKDSTARDVPADAPVDAALDTPGADRRQTDTARLDTAIDRSIGKQDTAIDRPADRRDTGSDGVLTDSGRD